MIRRFTLHSIAIAVAFLFDIAGAQITRHVPSQFPTIQAAIQAAASGDTVLVQPGTYTENIDFQGKNVSVSGAGAEVTTIHGTGVGPVVVFRSGEGPGALLQGFTVRGGVGGSEFLMGEAGGIDIRAASPTIRDCIITDNRGGYGPNDASTFHGAGPGGIQIRFSSLALVERCLISENFGYEDTVTLNAGGPGGIRCFGSGPNDPSQPTFRDCVVKANSGGHLVGSGGVWLFASSATFERCRIVQNAAGATASGAFAAAGGVTIAAGSEPMFQSCVIAQNRGGATIGNAGTGAVFSDASEPTFIGCTIAGNRAGELGTPMLGIGGIRSQAFSPGWPTISHCIVFGNRGAGANDEILITPSPAALAPQTVMHSDVEGGYAGPGNIDVDPLFIDAANGDYHLAASSPCIDAGSATVAGSGADDIDHDPRVFYAAADIGADEFLSPTIRGSVALGAGGPVPVLSVNGSAGPVATVARNVSVTIAVDQPPAIPSPASFVITGSYGTALLPAAEIALPLGWGPYALPLAGPEFFILAASFGPLAGAYTVAAPAPWSLTIPGGSPVALTVSLAGVITEVGSTIAVTNLVTLVVP